MAVVLVLELDVPGLTCGYALQSGRGLNEDSHFVMS